MNEGLQALGKARAYSYMLFGFDIALMLHELIAKLFNVSDTKILFGFLALVAIQATIGSMYLVKYASEARDIIMGSSGKRGKKGKKAKATKASAEREKEVEKAMMYASRARYMFLANYVVVILLLLNSLQIHSIFVDKSVVFAGIILIYFQLKYITILQRGRFN